MATVWQDGFDSYAATSDLIKQWTGGVGAGWAWVSNAGRNGGGCVQATGASQTFLQCPSGLINSTLQGYAFWMMCSAAPAALTVFIEPFSVNNVAQSKCGISTAGLLGFYDTFNVLHQNGVTNVCDNKWHWVELYLNQASGGIGKLFVDGNQEFNGATGLGSGAVDHFAIGSVISRTLTIDDFKVFDSTVALSPQPSDIPLGPQQIITVRPTSDSVVGFVTATGGGTHFNQVNEVNADGDTTYVEDGTSTDQDLYNFAAMGISPAKIIDVVAKAYASNPNIGSINFSQIAKTGTTQNNGTSVAVPVNYRTLLQAFPQDPTTSAAWASASAVDSAKFGVRVS